MVIIAIICANLVMLAMCLRPIADVAQLQNDDGRCRGLLTKPSMDIGWSHYAFVSVGHKRSGYEGYFVVSVCNFRLILQRNWQRSFVCAWIVTILLYILASALARSDLTMAWLRLMHHMNDGWSI